MGRSRAQRRSLTWWKPTPRAVGEGGADDGGRLAGAEHVGPVELEERVARLGAGQAALDGLRLEAGVGPVGERDFGVGRDVGDDQGHAGDVLFQAGDLGAGELVVLGGGPGLDPPGGGAFEQILAELGHEASLEAQEEEDGQADAGDDEDVGRQGPEGASGVAEAGACEVEV